MKTLISITAADKLNTIAEAIVYRELDVWHYQLNINNYTLMLEAFAPDGLSPEDVVYRDKIVSLLQSEKTEQSKSVRILDALMAQLPAGQESTLVLAAKDRTKVTPTPAPV